MSDIDEIKSRLDIVDVVSDYVALQKSGRNYKANCPFHTENTPSFIVDNSKQLWRCFGACSTGGDVFSFLMKIEGIEFGDAIKTLALRVGYELRPNSHAVKREDFYEINQIALDFYKDNLYSNEGKPAREYLQYRTINENMMEHFGIGYSSHSSKTLKSHLLFHSIDLDKSIECGLLNKFDDGKVRDFFWGRLMFPIHNKNGKVIGFGGRALDDSQPKYINTPTTPVFNKKNTLYGLHLAKQYVRKNDEIVIVEGYMDVISAHQYNFKNVVASMGTALTSEQVLQIKMMASSYVLALDQDVAGQEATLRSLESAWGVFTESDRGNLLDATSKTLKIMSIPNGKDPDEYIRSENSDWGKAVRESLPLIDYLIPTITSRFDLEIPGNKQKIIRLLVPILRKMDALDQNTYVSKLSEHIKAAPNVIEETIKIVLSQRNGKPKTLARNTENTNDNIRAEKLLSLIFQNDSLKDKAVVMNPEIFFDIEDRELFIKWMEESENQDIQELLPYELVEKFERILNIPQLSTEKEMIEAEFDFCVNKLEELRLKSRARSYSTSQDINGIVQDNISEMSEINSRIMDIHNK
jgi:DNA primase